MTRSADSKGLVAERAVLFPVSSQFQLLNGLAYAHHIRAKGSKAEIVFGLTDYWSTGLDGASYESVADELGVRITDMTGFQQDLARFKGAPGVVHLTTQPTYRRRKGARQVEIDDGTGNYRSDEGILYRDLCREAAVLGKDMPSRRKYALAQLKKRIRSLFVTVPHFGMLEDRFQSQVRPNAAYVESARAVLAGMSQAGHRHDLPDEPFAFLILPPMRLAHLAPDRDWLARLIDSLISDYGAVVLKPHPADHTDTLNFGALPVTLETSPGTAERLMFEAGDRIKAVVGFRSTASWTAKLLFDLPSLRVGPPVADPNVERIFGSLTEPYEVT